MDNLSVGNNIIYQHNMIVCDQDLIDWIGMVSINPIHQDIIKKIFNQNNFDTFEID
jgi:hypothetical protein